MKNQIKKKKKKENEDLVNQREGGVEREGRERERGGETGRERERERERERGQMRFMLKYKRQTETEKTKQHFTRTHLSTLFCTSTFDSFRIFILACTASAVYGMKDKLCTVFIQIVVAC